MLMAVLTLVLDFLLVLLGAFLLYLSVPAILTGTYTYVAFFVVACGLFIIGRAATGILPGHK